MATSAERTSTPPSSRRDARDGSRDGGRQPPPATLLPSSVEPDAGPEEKRPRFRPQRRRYGLRVVLAAAVLLAVGVAAWMKLRPKPVTTAAVVRGTAVEAVYATGTVEAYERVVVKAKTSGSVLEIKVKEGARVKKGELLAVIDSPTLRFELAKGKADLWAASQQAGTNAPQLAALESQAKVIEAELGTAKDDEARLKKLVESGAATQTDLDKARARLASVEAQLAANLAQRRALRIDLTARASGSNAAVDSLAARLADTEVRAPIDGVVLGRSVELGEVVMVNQPLFKVGDTDNLVLECAVDEADVARASVGRRVAVSLYAFPNDVFRGEIVEVMPDADRAKKAFLAKVRLSAPPPGLRSGMSAEVNVIIEERPGSLLAPAESIDAGGLVWVVGPSGRAERRAVKLGVRDMLRVEILGGLSEGEQVVIVGADALTDGARVKPTLKAMDMTAPASSAGKKVQSATL